MKLEIGQLDRFTIFTDIESMKITWHPKRGLAQVPTNQDIGLGTYEQLRKGVWRLRVKRRTGGRTWKLIPNSAPIIKRIHMEALLLGIQL